MSNPTVSVEFAYAARDDLYEIRSYFELKSHAASMHYERLFADAIAILKKFPRAGRERPDLPRPGVRSWPVTPYIILYTYEPPIVEIVRVVHGARDLPDIF